MKVEILFHIPFVTTEMVMTIMTMATNDENKTKTLVNSFNAFFEPI